MIVDLVDSGMMAERHGQWLEAARCYQSAIQEYKEAEDPFGVRDCIDEAYEGYDRCLKRMGWLGRLSCASANASLNAHADGGGNVSGMGLTAGIGAV